MSVAIDSYHDPDSTVWGSSVDLTQGFDGDGNKVKKVASDTTIDYTEGNTTTTTTTYLVRSSVLHQVLTEVSETGQKQRTFVYLGSAVLAWQRQSTDNSQAVLWEHRDPGNASYRVTGSGGVLAFSGLSAELDPLGNDAGLRNSIPNPQHKQTWSYPGFGSPNMSNDSQCTWDGDWVPCSVLGTITRTYNVDHIDIISRDPLFAAGLHAYTVHAAVRSRVSELESGEEISGWSAGKVIDSIIVGLPQFGNQSQPQNYALHDVWLQTPEQMRRRQMTPEEISNFRGQLQSIYRGDCKKFLDGIQANIPGAHNLVDVFNYMADHGGLFHQDGLTIGRGFQIGGYGGGNIDDGSASVTINFGFPGDPLFTMIHEGTHASGGAGSGSVSHRTMAEAALSAAASANINLQKYQNGPPSDLKFEVWARGVPNADTHNSQVFQSILHIVCDPYAKK
ncbi:MAG TPA: hypothetical protein VEM96_08885 [Pyrinomonadaceae bacterium]|nr:hypothetical protein [Pyrinomonadaceae bacterium]